MEQNSYNHEIFLTFLESCRSKRVVCVYREGDSIQHYLGELLSISPDFILIKGNQVRIINMSSIIHLDEKGDRHE